jgi:hypothetical protein
MLVVPQWRQPELAMRLGLPASWFDYEMDWNEPEYAKAGARKYLRQRGIIDEVSNLLDHMRLYNSTFVIHG